VAQITGRSRVRSAKLVVLACMADSNKIASGESTKSIQPLAIALSGMSGCEAVSGA